MAREAAEIGSPLFNELKELFVDGDLKEFVSSLGQHNLADKIGCIGEWKADTTTMSQLIAAITDEPQPIDFDITDYLEIMKADIVGEEAVLQVKVLKQAHEEVEFIIKQGDNTKSDRLNLMDNKIGSIWQLKFAPQMEEGKEDIRFLMERQEIKKMPPTTDRTFTANGVTFVMKRVEGGAFWMGAQSTNPSEQNYDKEARANESPVHRVTIDTFYIGETTVVQKLWAAVMGCNPSRFVQEEKPVDGVSWDDCVVFVRELNEITQSQRGQEEFRLPTEAEWEYAAKGGWKNEDYNSYAGSNRIRDVAWHHADRSHRVKGFCPNELGIFDMSGNVWEWCQDFFGENYYRKLPSNNPKGPAKGYYRVLRGGGWRNDASACRVSYRDYNSPSCADDDYGFRLVLSA